MAPAHNSQRSAYNTVYEELRLKLAEALKAGSKRLLATYLQTLLAYPDGCTRGETVFDPRSGDVIVQVPAVSSATASGNSVTLGLASALTSGQVVTVAYVDATAGNDPVAVQDAAGNDADTFTQTVSNAVCTGCSVVDGCYVVSADWGLIPTGLSAGAEFRLIFISSGTRNAAPTDIADYNTFVRTAAAAGHADIQQYSSTFRVVGSTADVDARDNTATTYTADEKGVAIYWLGGNKVADEYEDFYDGGWDDEANAKDESGNNRSTSGNSNRPSTGSGHDGTEDIIVGSSFALGANPVTYGILNSATSGNGPLSSSSAFNNTAAQPFYGLSPVFRVEGQVVTNTAPAFTTGADFSTNENQAATFEVTAEDADAGDAVTYAITGGADLALFSINATSGLLDEDSEYQVQVRATNDEGDGAWSSPGSGSTDAPAEEMGETTVPADWSLIPTGLGPGDSFRLLFIGTSSRNASSSDIDVYNTFVQNLVETSGHEDIKALSGTFRMLGSTEDVDARDNTGTTGTGVAIYWLGGAKVADDNADFYDGGWDEEAMGRRESGVAVTIGNTWKIWTGRPLFRPIAPTPVLVSSPTGL